MIYFFQLEKLGDISNKQTLDYAFEKVMEHVQSDTETADVNKIYSWMETRKGQGRHEVMKKLYQSIVEDVLHQRREMPISLPASTKRADDALRKATEMEAKVNRITLDPERDEEALKGIVIRNDTTYVAI